MAAAKDILETYQREQVTMASPETLVLMLYEAALKSIREEKEHLDGSVLEVLERSQLAREILLELADNVNLEHPKGQTVRDLYLYCWRTVIAAPSRPDGEAELEAVDRVLTNLIDGLRQYMSTQPNSRQDGDDDGPATSLNFVG